MKFLELFKFPKEYEVWGEPIRYGKNLKKETVSALAEIDILSDFQSMLHFGILSVFASSPKKARQKLEQNKDKLLEAFGISIDNLDELKVEKCRRRTSRDDPYK